jgi:hypothetical protein
MNGVGITLGWKPADDTRELDALRASPIGVLVACWYDGQLGTTFVCEAEYAGVGNFNRRGGGSLGACVVTHWQWKPAPPAEDVMLAVSRRLQGISFPGGKR